MKTNRVPYTERGHAWVAKRPAHRSGEYPEGQRRLRARVAERRFRPGGEPEPFWESRFGIDYVGMPNRMTQRHGGWAIAGGTVGKTAGLR